MVRQDYKMMLVGLLAMIVAIESVSAVITVQIGGATRLTSLNRQRDRYNCYWDCDLVGCQIARDDDECAYDCEKICRVRYDYSAVGRSGSNSVAAAASNLNSDLKPKSGAPQATEEKVESNDLPNELIGGKLKFKSWQADDI